MRDHIAQSGSLLYRWRGVLCPQEGRCSSHVTGQHGQKPRGHFLPRQLPFPVQAGPKWFFLLWLSCPSLGARPLGRRWVHGLETLHS